VTDVQAVVSADSVRAVLDEVFGAARYQWQVRPDPWRWLRRLLGDVVTWMNQLEGEHPVAYYALVVGLTALLVAILVHLGYLTWLSFRARQATGGGSTEITRVVRDAAWHRERARELEALGRYRESLAHRFAALVALLDRREVVRAHPSKTPGEYVQEARLGPAGRAALAAAVGWLYDHLFGGEPLDPALLAEFDRRAEEVAAHGAA